MNFPLSCRQLTRAAITCASRWPISPNDSTVARRTGSSRSRSARSRALTVFGLPRPNLPSALAAWKPDGTIFVPEGPNEAWNDVRDEVVHFGLVSVTHSLQRYGSVPADKIVFVPEGKRGSKAVTASGLVSLKRPSISAASPRTRGGLLLSSRVRIRAVTTSRPAWCTAPSVW